MPMTTHPPVTIALLLSVAAFNATFSITAAHDNSRNGVSPKTNKPHVQLLQINWSSPVCSDTSFYSGSISIDNLRSVTIVAKGRDLVTHEDLVAYVDVGQVDSVSLSRPAKLACRPDALLYAINLRGHFKRSITATTTMPAETGHVEQSDVLFATNDAARAAAVRLRCAIRLTKCN